MNKAQRLQKPCYFVAVLAVMVCMAGSAFALTNQQLIDKYNSGQKLTAEEYQQLKNAGATVRGTGKDERLVFRRPENPAKEPQESAYRYWLRRIGGKVK